MPISNGSQTWPKILVCTTCRQPVERELARETRVGEYIYSCSSCDAFVAPESLKWVEEGDALSAGKRQRCVDADDDDASALH